MCRAARGVAKYATPRAAEPDWAYFPCRASSFGRMKAWPTAAQTTLPSMVPRTPSGVGYPIPSAISATEPATAPDHVLVDDAEGTESHVTGVMVLAEGERVAGIEPSEIEVTAVL